MSDFKDFCQGPAPDPAAQRLYEYMVAYAMRINALTKASPHPTEEELALRRELHEHVEVALSGDRHRARALMGAVSYLLQFQDPLPHELSYYVGKAFHRVAWEGKSPDKALGFTGRSGPLACIGAEGDRYLDLIKRVRHLGVKPYQIKIPAAEGGAGIAEQGLLKLDGSGEYEPCTPSSAYAVYKKALAYFDRLATDWASNPPPGRFER